MAELITYLIILLAFCLFDIRLILKKGQKRNIAPYLLLFCIAGFLGVIYFTKPETESISGFVNRLFMFKE